MATIPAHENEFPSLLFVEAAAPATPGTGLIIAYAKAGGVFAWKDDAGVEHIVGEGDTAAHLADTADAHDASAISFTPAGTIAATDVQAAIEEVASEAGGTPSFSGARVRHDAVQTVTANTETTMTFDTEVYDTDAIYDAGAPTRLTAHATGYWRIRAQIYNVTAGVSYMLLRVDGTTTIPGSEIDIGSAATVNHMIAEATIHLTAGQYVEVRHYGAGTSRGSATDALNNTFEAHYLGA